MSLETGKTHRESDPRVLLPTSQKVGEILEGRRFISRVQKLDAPTSHITLRAYATRDVGEFVSESPANQDVVDVITYVKKDGKIFIATVANVRPGPIVHDIQDAGGYTLDHADFIELPAGIIRADKGESELTSTAERVAREKLGAKEFKRVFHLGGVRTHSPSKTTELTYPIAIELASMPQVGGSTEEDVFQMWSKVEWRSLEDIVSGYLTGKIQDTRLITSVFDIADREKYPLPLNFVKRDEVQNHAHVPDGFRILDIGSVNQSGAEKTESLSEIPYGDISQPFLSASKYEIATQGRGGKEGRMEADVSYRTSGNDTVDFAGYILINHVPYMALSFQDRPNLELRDREYHPIYSEHTRRLLHGISRVTDRGESEASIQSKIMERIGGKGLSSIEKIGHDYPTAGHSAERVTRYIGELSEQGESTGTTMIMSVDDILMLAKRGEIIDSRLILNAHIIKQAFGHQTLDDFYESDIIAYEKMVRSGSRIFAGLLANDGKLRDLHIHCLRFPEYRRRILFAEQELGAAAFDFTDEHEKGFFDASIPVFANPTKVTPENAELYLLYLLHDFDHYRMGEFIPWYMDDSGKMRIHERDTYQKMMAWTEAEAVYYSDVVTPNFIGIERFESIINPGKNPAIISLGRAFRDMGIDGETARTCLLEIERDGVIPDVLKKAPRFEEFKELFIGRMLRFHVLDYYQAGFEYDWWKSHQHVAEVMLRFGITKSNPEEFVRGFDESAEMLASYKEGFNPLRAELARMINVDIRILALKIAYVMDCSSDNASVVSWAHRHLDEIERMQSELKSHMAQVKNTSTSVVNLRAYKSIEPIKKMLTSIASITKQAGFTRELTDDEREAFETRIFPYFKPYESLDPEQEPMKSALEQLIAKNGL